MADDPNAIRAETEADNYIPKPSHFDPELLAPLETRINEVNLDQFVSEYYKLQKALEKSHEGENRFMNKCKALSKSIATLTSNLAAMEECHVEDTKEKEKLKQKIEQSAKVKAELLAGINEQKKKILQYRAEIKELDEAMEESTSDAIRSKQTQIERSKLDRTKYERIHKTLSDNITTVLKKYSDLVKQQEKVEQIRKKGLRDLEELAKRIRDTKAAAAKETRHSQELGRQVKDLENQVNSKKTQINLKKENLDKSRQMMANVEKRLAKAEQIVEKHREEFMALTEKAQRMNDQLIGQREANEAAFRVFKKQERLAEDEEKQVRLAKRSNEQKKRILAALKERVSEVEREKNKAEERKAKHIQNMKDIEQKIHAKQGALNRIHKKMDTKLREREVLSQNHNSKVESIKAQSIALRIKKSTLKNIKNEHQSFLISIRNLNRNIDKLERDYKKHETDLNKRNIQREKAEKEVAERSDAILELQQQITINEGKLRVQQNLLENVRSDRNLYRKQLIEQKNEMHEHKRKYDNLTLQIKQLKAEIAEKDIGFVTEHFNLEHVKNEISSLKTLKSSSSQRASLLDSSIKDQAAQIRKLSTIIADADEELRVQTKQYNTIVNEQRVLNQQLIKRNDELARLYEHLKLQNSVLKKGQACYREKQSTLKQKEDIRGDLNTQLDAVLSDIERYEELKTTIGDLQNELLEEQLKVKALTDELKKPINIHRWKRLMDTDTDTYGMINKVRMLQQAIIKKSSQVEEKDKQIQEKEKLYVDLRRVLARQPGNEAADQLRLYAQTLRDKRAKYKTMKADLKRYQAKVYEFKYDIQKQQQDMELIKLEYFAAKRREARAGGPRGMSRGTAASRGSASTTSRMHSRASARFGEDQSRQSGLSSQGGGHADQKLDGEGQHQNNAEDTDSNNNNTSADVVDHGYVYGSLAKEEKSGRSSPGGANGRAAAADSAERRSSGESNQSIPSATIKRQPDLPSADDDQDTQA